MGRTRALGVALVGAVAASLAAGGCSDWSDRVDSRAATAGLPDLLVDLTAERWELDGAGAGDPVTLELDAAADDNDDDGDDADGTVAGQAPCNTYRGTFELDGEDGIEIDDLATTRMACVADVMDAEAAYLDNLAAVTTVDLDDDAEHLVLSTGDGTELSFTAADDD